MKILITQAQLDALRGDTTGLLDEIVRLAKLQKQPAYEGQPIQTVFIDTAQMGQAFISFWNTFVSKHGVQLVGESDLSKPPEAPAALTAPQEDSLAKMQRERRETLVAESADADACVREWMAAGLLQSKYNDELFERWHQANPQAGWTRNNINAMIQALPQLQWAIWSKYAPGAKAPEPVDEETPVPEGLPYTRKQLIRKLSELARDHEARHRFFQHWGVEAINKKLAEPEEQPVA